ncbi:hypothetical protein K7G98_27605, partial [Saccharothrix sp. MB29]|nr:hypothetical protein [Saccharothrix sp. MB29]
MEPALDGRIRRALMGGNQFVVTFLPLALADLLGLVRAQFDLGAQAVDALAEVVVFGGEAFGSVLGGGQGVEVALMCSGACVFVVFLGCVGANEGVVALLGWAGAFVESGRLGREVAGVCVRLFFPLDVLLDLLGQFGAAGSGSSASPPSAALLMKRAGRPTNCGS